MTIVLRQATTADVPDLGTLIESSARSLSAGYYTPRQIDAALKYVFGVNTLLIADGTYYAALDGGAIVGCGGWSRLLEACESAARQAGFARMELMSTLPGVPLYAAHGFLEVERVTDTLPDGTAIDFVRMEKSSAERAPRRRPPSARR